MSWPLVNLGKLFKITSGATPSRKQTSYYEKGKIKWVKTGDLHQKYIDSTSECITAVALEQSSTRLYPPGTVLLAMYGATIGACSILNVEACTNQACAAFVPSKEIDVLYLYYFLLSQKKNFVNAGEGGAQPNISARFLRDYEIPVPPLPIQKQIASVLEKADTLRQQSQQLEQELTALSESVFLDMFGDPALNPKGFSSVFLNECYVQGKESTKCGPFGSALKKSEFVSTGIPVWNMDNITKSGALIEKPGLWITKQKYEELKQFKVNKGDIIISRAGTVGKMCVVNSQFEESIISTNLIRLRLDERKLLPQYFVSLMTFCKGRVGRLKTGPDGSFSHMNTGILDTLKFPYPDIRLQHEFLKILVDIEKNRDHSKEKMKHLEENFNSLMQRAFKGELNLKDVA